MSSPTRALVAVILVQAFVNALLAGALAGSLHYVTSALVRASQRGGV